MKKLLSILLVLYAATFAQKAKLIISVSGELGLDMADVLMDGISYGLKNNDKYQILINDRQFKETLKKEWQKGNISDDRIIALAQRAGADYLCFTKIKSVKGLKGKQVTAQVYDLATMSYTDQMGMKTIESDFSDLKHLTEIILNVVDDMLGTSNRANMEELVQKSSRVSNYSNVFTDSRDGKKYRTTVIGKQTWMAENLNYNASGSKCYDNNPANCSKYGRLYDWNTAREVCPSGWHLPSDVEWTTLTDFIGGAPTAGTKLKATNGWNNYSGSSGNGTDDYGFSALPGGFGNSVGSFYDAGYSGYWWSASEVNSYYAYDRFMDYDYGFVFYNDGGKSRLFSVRCVKD